MERRYRLRQDRATLDAETIGSLSFSAGAFPSVASITAELDDTFTVVIAATDLGTGARTALTAIAADALAVDIERVRLRISDSELGPAWSAGGSRGTTSWAWAITEAAARLRDRPRDPSRRVTVTVDTSELLDDLPSMERHAYSAVFTEVTVDPATGEVRVRRLLGMFAVGRVVNPLTARSQVIGGMIGGLPMALHEEGMRDRVSGRHVNADFAGYHIAAHADVPDIEADFVPDYEPGIPFGIKGAGPHGAMIRQIGLADSNLTQVSRAIQWIRDNYAEPIRIADLARLAGMSTSAFHRHFRAITTLSPLQYQKRIRLQEARSLLVARAGDVVGVAHLVGYDSPSQFNREYRRLFGTPPAQDAARLRAE